MVNRLILVLHWFSFVAALFLIFMFFGDKRWWEYAGEGFLAGLATIPVFAVIMFIIYGRWIWFPWQHDD
ncbi:MAG: hypothetical protein CBC23_008890 [Rhodospirillaceae bacterium TMED63]|nr:MAG: hypothetical protein CBC23_008890 [Rhodospirillaceae bacterium TMED63]